MEIELNDDEFYITCPVCQKEQKLDNKGLIFILEYGHLSGAAKTCSEECSMEYYHEGRKKS